MHSIPSINHLRVMLFTNIAIKFSDHVSMMTDKCVQRRYDILLILVWL